HRRIGEHRRDLLVPLFYLLDSLSHPTTRRRCEHTTRADAQEPGQAPAPGRLLRGALVSVALTEALHPPRRVHQLLLAGKVRVTRRTDFHLNARLCRPRLQRVAARTVDG